MSRFRGHLYWELTVGPAAAGTALLWGTTGSLWKTVVLGTILAFLFGLWLFWTLGEDPRDGGSRPGRRSLSASLPGGGGVGIRPVAPDLRAARLR